jgi:hypothetical protein
MKKIKSGDTVWMTRPMAPVVSRMVSYPLVQPVPMRYPVSTVVDVRRSIWRADPWAPCVYCKQPTRCHYASGPASHMLCHRMEYSDDSGVRRGPNRHDHKRAGTVPDRSWRPPPQPAPLTEEQRADFWQGMKSFYAGKVATR